MLEVRDRAVVELLNPPFLDHERRVTTVVRQHEDVPVDPLAARERASDLAEVLVVRVDVLEVIDLDAELLVERVERRPPLRLLVDVDVERPVREVDSLRELVRAGCALLAGAAARGQQAGNREDGATCGGPLEQLASGEDVGHSDPSKESTTNVQSGLQLSVRRVPGEAASRPGAAFCRYTVSRPHSVSTMYWVATPTYACSTTVPSSALAWPAPSSIFSGLIPTATSPLRPASASGRTRTSGPCRRRTVSEPFTVPAIRFETPRKPATKAVAGVSYNSVGVPSCSMWPWFMTAIRSAIVIASSWSCVTWMNVIPTSCWIDFSSSCICLRSLRSSAPSGSSSSSTCGLFTSARASATRCC